MVTQGVLWVEDWRNMALNPSSHACLASDTGKPDTMRVSIPFHRPISAYVRGRKFKPSPKCPVFLICSRKLARVFAYSSWVFLSTRLSTGLCDASENISKLNAGLEPYRLTIFSKNSLALSNGFLLSLKLE